MTKYMVFQFKDVLRDHINATGWGDPLSSCYADATCGFDKSEQLNSARILYNKGYYRHVASMNASSLNSVFRSGQSIDSHWVDHPAIFDVVEDRNVSSVSIGDLIYDPEAKEFHIVARYGFEKIGLEYVDLKEG